MIFWASNPIQSIDGSNPCARCTTLHRSSIAVQILTRGFAPPTNRSSTDFVGGPVRDAVSRWVGSGGRHVPTVGGPRRAMAGWMRPVMTERRTSESHVRVVTRYGDTLVCANPHSMVTVFTELY